MKTFLVYVKSLPAYGMAIFPFILLKNEKLAGDAILINHEKIHLRQQLELLILPFYILYGLNYLINIIRLKDHRQAYLQLIFEKEAFQYEADLKYLKVRPAYNWLKFL